MRSEDAGQYRGQGRSSHPRSSTTNVHEHNHIDPQVEPAFASPMMLFQLQGASPRMGARRGAGDSVRRSDREVIARRLALRRRFLRSHRARMHGATRAHPGGGAGPPDCSRPISISPRTARYCRAGLTSIRSTFDAPHDHSGFALSGVYYASVPPEGSSGAIEFLTHASTPSPTRWEAPFALMAASESTRDRDIFWCFRPLSPTGCSQNRDSTTGSRSPSTCALSSSLIPCPRWVEHEQCPDVPQPRVHVPTKSSAMNVLLARLSILSVYVFAVAATPAHARCADQ